MSGGKKIVIGDVHGNHVGVSDILNQADYNPGRDTLIFVGDYIDGFADLDINPRKTIELLCDLKQDNKNVFTIFGNHDLWMREWIEAGNALPNLLWYQQGGALTLESYGIPYIPYGAVKHLIPKRHIQFLFDLLPVYIDDELVVVHGGFKTRDDILAASMKSQTYNMLWDRSFYNTRDTNILNFYREVFGNRMFVCGHTPYGPHIAENPKRICIDGGSKGGGALHGLIIENDGTYKIIKEL